MGYDVHQLDENNTFLLGGVHIDYEKGIVAHSDGDIVFHALADALLGAAGLGDIGHFFPDTDMKYKNLDSSLIIVSVLEKLKQLSYDIVNIDITVVLETPKLQPYLYDIKNSISNYLKISSNNINIKATTNEKSGLIGSGDFIACWSNVSLKVN